MTAEIANALDGVPRPQSVAVFLEETHGCITSRDVHQSTSPLVTRRLLGVFRDRAEARLEFLSQSTSASAWTRKISWARDVT